MREKRYEPRLYPENLEQLEVFAYGKKELQNKLSSLLDEGYELSKSYAENGHLTKEELEERIDTTRNKVEIISSILSPEETFQPIEQQIED